MFDLYRLLYWNAWFIQDVVLECLIYTRSCTELSDLYGVLIKCLIYRGCYNKMSVIYRVLYWNVWMSVLYLYPSDIPAYYFPICCSVVNCLILTECFSQLAYSHRVLFLIVWFLQCYSQLAYSYRVLFLSDLNRVLFSIVWFIQAVILNCLIHTDAWCFFLLLLTYFPREKCGLPARIGFFNNLV